MNGIRLYLSGKMSGIENYNYPAFNAAAKKLREQGFHVENPAENDAPEVETWENWMKSAIRQMLTCHVVVLLPDWNHSKGANMEVSIANQLGIPCMTIGHALADPRHVAMRLGVAA